MAKSKGNQRAISLATTCLAVLSLSAVARAENPASSAAETLYKDAKVLMEGGHYAAACPKLEESNRLDPGTGTLLALALCHEGEGKTASAWGEFTAVAVASKRAGRIDREQLARERAAALEKILSRLTIKVDDGQKKSASLEVKLDGVLVRAEDWGVAKPADPGTHLVEASAPGKKAFASTVIIEATNDTKSVTLALEDVKPESSPPPRRVEAPSSEPSAPSSRRTWSFIVGGAGVAVLGAGVVVGAVAVSKNNDAKALCAPGTRCMDLNAVGLSHDAGTFATIADVGVLVGLVGVGVGTYLFITSSPHAPTVHVAPLVGRAGTGVSVQANW
jgi:hypothetical protein